MVETKETIKQLAWRRLDQLAEDEKRNHPQLSYEQCYARILESHEGKSAYGVSHHADADLTVKQHQEKQLKKAELGGSFGDALCQIAHALDPTDFDRGLQRVGQSMPGLIKAWQEERR